MKDEMTTKQKKIADHIKKRYGDLAHFATIFAMGSIESEKSLNRKIAVIEASMMAFASTVLEREEERNAKK